MEDLVRLAADAGDGTGDGSQNDVRPLWVDFDEHGLLYLHLEALDQSGSLLCQEVEPDKTN